MTHSLRFIATLVLATFAFLVQPSLVSAQASVGFDVAGGYAALRILGTESTPSTNFPVGWFVSGAVRLGDRRLVPFGEVSAQARTSETDERQTLFAWFGGARWLLRETSRMALFVQGAVGAERFSEPGLSETGLAMQPGAGVDWRLRQNVSARAAVDYRMTRVEDATFKALRVTIGASVRFGG